MRLGRALGATAIASACLVSDAATQEPPDSALRLEPVMVRVLRSTIGTGEPTPVSLAAGPELTRGNAGAFLDDALRAIPGVTVQNRFNFAVGERLAIRGFGSRAQFGVRGIRLLVDGIPATLPDGQATIDHLDLADLGRVEVLRGPSASLYGNAAGGVLHFRTLDPRSEPAAVTARTVSGSNGLLSLQGGVSGTAGGTGYRAGYSRLTYDGFRRDPIAADGSTYGSAERSVVNATLSRGWGRGTLRIVANGVDLDAENPGSLSQAVLDTGDRKAWDSNVTNRTSKQIQQGQLGATWTGPFGGTDAEVSAWGLARNLTNPIPGDIIDLDRKGGGVRTLFRGSRPAGDGTLSWGAGAELELQRDDRQNYANNAGVKGALSLDQAEHVTGAGVFAQARLDVAAGLSALAGLRYDRIRFAAIDRYFVGGDPDDTGERVMDAVSPSAGLVFSTDPALELFASVSRSFETPTTTELANQPTGSGGFNPDLNPQHGFTYEGGARGRLVDTWSVEGSVFHTTLSDELISFQVPADPGRDFYRNSGESHHTGWEIAVDGRPVPEVSTRVAYTHVNARFDSYVTATDDYSGNRIPGLAPNRVDGLFSYERGSAFVELRGVLQDGTPVNDSNIDGGGQPIESAGYFVADASAGFHELPLGTWAVSPFVGVSNLTDEGYNSSVAVNAFGSRYFEPGPRRTYRVGFGVTWGR